MQLAEVGKLLAVIRSFDNRKLDESTAYAWKLLIDREFPDATLEESTEVVLDWFGTANPYFEARHLLDGLRRKRRRFAREIEADVRAAKMRGLLRKDWPSRQALPLDVERKLAEARAADSEIAAAHALEGPNVSPLKLEVGRRVE